MNTDKKTYYVISGEGTVGTWSRKVATESGIQRILSRERCGGDRWARAYGDIHKTAHGKVGYDIETGEQGVIGC